MKLRYLYIITFTFCISLCCLTSCGGTSEEISEEEIERIANERFNALTDTLTQQYDKECDSLFSQYVQSGVDSLIFEFLKSEDSTSNKTPKR